MQKQLRDIEQQIIYNDNIVKSLHQMNTTVTKHIVNINNETLQLKSRLFRSKRQLGKLVNV